MNNPRKAKEHALPNWQGLVLAVLLRLMKLTWRVSFVGLPNLTDNYGSGKPVFLYFWHGKYVPILPILEGYEGCVISSISTRGNNISTICNQFGFNALLIPDIPTRQSIKAMLAGVVGYKSIGTAADGPLGPPQKVKSGIVWIASKTSSATIPVSVASDRKWVLSKRWDGMQIPKPFAKVTIMFGEPIYIPSPLNTAQTERCRATLSVALSNVDAVVEALVAH